ncbi:MAG: hypothetical protein VW338_08655 [Rhodospirillaceae bacterium]
MTLKLAALLVYLADGLLGLAWWLTTRIRCAWCGIHLSGNPIAPRISHGMCPGCQARQQAEFNETRNQERNG